MDGCGAARRLSGRTIPPMIRCSAPETTMNPQVTSAMVVRSDLFGVGRMVVFFTVPSPTGIRLACPYP
jgi:hypothetical protein